MCEELKKPYSNLNEYVTFVKKLKEGSVIY
jgi:dynein heavy chain